MANLQDTLIACKTFLPESFQKEHARLWEPEHIERLATRLLKFSQEGVPEVFPPPHFSVECTPPLAMAYAYFQKPLGQWQPALQKDAPELARLFAEAMQTATCKHILILLGQRQTPASLTDARGIPPTRAKLLESINRVHSQGLTVGGRAWAKHAPRSTDKFWGEVRGSAADKNQSALKIITHILDHTTWWNVFGHFAHDTVYEARVASGHGVRWGKAGQEFIGFLEPFDE